MEVLQHALCVIKALGLRLHIPQRMLLKARIRRLHFENAHKLIVVCGRVLYRVDHWERKFALGQVFTKPLGCSHLDEFISTRDWWLQVLKQGLTCSEQRLL